MMSDFVPKLAEYPKRRRKPKIEQNSVRAYSLAQLSDAACVLLALITHRRSTAKRGGCFQRRLFQTIRHKMMKLGSSVLETKISFRFEFDDQAPPGSPHPKMWHFAESLRKIKQSNVGVSGCHTVRQ